jgi:transposase-like protein
VFARSQIHIWLQHLLEEEVGEPLGRDRYHRRKGADVSIGWCNDYGPPRRRSMSYGTITVRLPRVRGLEERFERRILPLFERRKEPVGELLPQIYLHGLARRDFDVAFGDGLNDGSPLSASSIARLDERWCEAYRSWRLRPFEGDFVYLWAGGNCVAGDIEKEKADLPLVIGALPCASRAWNLHAPIARALP